MIATDASPAMLEVARKYLGGEAPELRRIALRDDPLPEADAIVGIARLADAFGDETPPEGLRVITGIRER